MADQGQEQNRSEEATPFKLERARKKGSVARGTDLGYLGGLVALAAFLVIAGDGLIHGLSQMMRHALAAGAGAGSPHEAAAGPAMIAALYRSALQPVLLLGGTAIFVVLLLEILQLRGFVFSTHPLKPDFSRISPAAGLKRLFSGRVLKEALKNIVKLAVYALVAALAIGAAVAGPGRAIADAYGLTLALEATAMRLLFLFIGAALLFAAIDQIIVRHAFRKQMRMSRSELTREHKEREGEPRIKQKRKQLHEEFAKQSNGLKNLSGADMLVVNPDHYAVALRYDTDSMAAPAVTGKARNHYALMMKSRAFRLGIPIFEQPPLARALYAECESGQQIGPGRYREVADLYLKIRQSRSAGP